MNANDFCTVITTTDSVENAERITKALLEEKLAACVQASEITSSYSWKGQIVTDKEIRLDIKTKVSLFASLKERIEALHTYEVPEILMFRVDDAKFDYLRWIDEETMR